MKTLTQYINEKQMDSKGNWENEDMWKNQGKKRGLTLGGKVWDLMYKVQKNGYAYVSKLEALLEKNFPNIDEWKMPAPNKMEQDKELSITAMKDNKVVAKLHVSDLSEKQYIYLDKIQDFLDKVNEA